MNGKERCLAAVAGGKADRTPLFPLTMGLAADRAGIKYREYASSGAALAQAQLLMRSRYGLDAITACSDAFRASADLGGEILFPDDLPPHLAAPLIRDEGDLGRLHRPDPLKRGSRMRDRVDAVSEMLRACGEECLVLGWVDLPFAEACSACGVEPFLMMLFDAPDLAHRILDFMTSVVVDFAIAQLDAGCPMIGGGDAAASLISPEFYRSFALPYEQRVFEAIKAKGGLGKLHICGNTSALLEDMVQSGADLYNVDHLVDFGRAAECYAKAGKAFKGNLDPVADFLQSDPDTCFRRTRSLIETAKGKPYLLSAGCEIPAATADEVLDAFCGAALG
ncbi:MAG TPA: uroporphyrinogen decarboxylase family protein [Rectinemataceae bacterium]|nr:uroporphyrinogen decarboxylase family protein [Rectinemataceae bacterium]